jgi:malonyl-CoA/methylmalonyl-CoA synthetase
MLAIQQQALKYPHKTAIISQGQSFTYKQLTDASSAFASVLLGGKKDLNEARVAFMVTPGFDYVRVQWGVWLAGGTAVPLCVTHPLPSLRYTIEDSEAEILVVSKDFEPILGQLAREKGFRMIVLGENDKSFRPINLPDVLFNRRAMILYTSGTTNLPKGVVTTHANLEAQISTLIDAWKWSHEDHVVCVLPLHHVHGIVNVVSCALWAGAACEFIPQFSAESVFEAFKKAKINVFMAVPTIYFKLITYFETLSERERESLTEIMQKFRLMVCGSAALPVSVMERWESISGHTLLERYGMTEIGMGLSNPYKGQRYAGHVGYPLRGVEIRLADDNDNEIKGEAGEIQVRGANVFTEYWRKPEVTAASFTKEGWFKTGDVAVLDTEGGYRILGRNSTDIIKSGGYKISALEIEEVLRTHPAINDCSVVGIDDDEWGEIVATALVSKDKSLDFNELSTWMRDLMPAYRVPRLYKIVEDLPRNAMGKVTKNDVKEYFREVNVH